MIKLLSIDALSDIYEKEMREAFPAEELKPLKRMVQMMDAGRYDVWGYYEQETLLAYACIYHDGGMALLDYFAVVQGHRASGHGSTFLAQLLNDVTDYGTMMIEIEAVDDATNEAMYQERQRRQVFYERLGYKCSAVEAFVFGVHYWVMVPEATPEDKAVKENMEKVYRYFVPQEEKYQAHIMITMRSNA